MKVIFLRDVPGVGKKYDVKDMPDGYVINFLLPRQLARSASAHALAELESMKRGVVIEREVQENLLLKNLQELKGKTVIIKGKANEKGHLFSAIHKKEIIEAMSVQHRAEIGEEFVVLEKPIKSVGEFEIPIEVKGKKSSFILLVQGI